LPLPVELLFVEVGVSVPCGVPSIAKMKKMWNVKDRATEVWEFCENLFQMYFKCISIW